MKSLIQTLGLGVACISAVAVIFVAENGAAQSPDDLRVMMMQKLREAPSGSTIAFHEGDLLPYEMHFGGDLLETRIPATSYVTVKKSFWVRAEGQEILLSFDGEHFRPANQVLSGEIKADAGAEQNGGVATGIHTSFEAVLK